jgi:hypothetical protein
MVENISNGFRKPGSKTGILFKKQEIEPGNAPM